MFSKIRRLTAAYLQGAGTLLIVVFATGSALSATSITLDLSSFPQGATTPLSYIDSKSGITVSITSYGRFAIDKYTFPPGDGITLLEDMNGNGFLVLDLSSPVDSFSLKFGFYGVCCPQFLQADAWDGIILMGSTKALANSSHWPYAVIEGSMDVSFPPVYGLPRSFDHLVLYTTAPQFAIGGPPIDPVPEPGSILLGLSGIMALVIRSRRTHSWCRRGLLQPDGAGIRQG